jgi:hypothetical protein
MATAGAALASLAMLASAAHAAPPAAPYQDFAGCPSPAESSTVGFCFKTVFTDGHISLGKRTIPITNPITLRGGIDQVTGTFASNSEGGIVPVKQQVPGGLVGLTGMSWLDELLDQPQLRLYATVELAGQPGSLLEEPLTLPIKVHLENPVLGNSCYVGSDATPITLNLITGTTNPPAPNKPISGKPASEFAPEASRPEVLIEQDGVFVDNSYAVPGATGCQIKLGSIVIPINGLVDASSALPAAAGTNEASLGFDLSVVSPEVVYP